MASKPISGPGCAELEQDEDDAGAATMAAFINIIRMISLVESEVTNSTSGLSN